MTTHEKKRRARGDTQSRVLAFIRQEVAEKGYPPSVREIGEAVGLKSTSTVHGHLRRLEAKGLLVRDAMKPRAMGIVDEDAGSSDQVRLVPMLGPVAAGSPILAEENPSESLPVPASLLGDGTYFALTIRGESMIQAGIMHGDYVIVKRQHEANNGDIVVMIRRCTVKDSTGAGRVRSAKSGHEAHHTNAVEILGKVISVYRQL